MRKISLWLFILVFTASLARAQDDAAQQQIDKLSGQIQDLLDAQAAQGKRIDALEKKISDLGDKLIQPAASKRKPSPPARLKPSTSMPSRKIFSFPENGKKPCRITRARSNWTRTWDALTPGWP